jgi:hypothetical protein
VNDNGKLVAEVPSTVVQIVISLDQVTNKISVNGPIQNKILCYGLLEAAKDAVRDYIQKNTGVIIQPSASRPM